MTGVHCMPFKTGKSAAVPLFIRAHSTMTNGNSTRPTKSIILCLGHEQIENTKVGSIMPLIDDKRNTITRSER